MHSIRLDIDVTVYAQFMAFVKQYRKNEINIIEDPLEDSEALKTFEALQKTTLSPESLAHDAYWDDIDRQIDNIQ